MKHKYPVVVVWPETSSVGCVAGRWKRLEDGRIEATYDTPEELGLAMSFARVEETPGPRNNGRRPLNDQPVPVWDLQHWLDQRGLRAAGEFKFGRDGLALEVSPADALPANGEG